MLAYETGVVDAVDPLAGSYYLERLTDAVEAEAGELLRQVEDLGGSVKAIEAGFIQAEIEESAYRYQRQIESDEQVIVGVNRFEVKEDAAIPIQTIDPAVQGERERQLRDYRQARDQRATDAVLAQLRKRRRRRRQSLSLCPGGLPSRGDPRRNLWGAPRRVGRVQLNL